MKRFTLSLLVVLLIVLIKMYFYQNDKVYQGRIYFTSPYIQSDSFTGFFRNKYYLQEKIQERFPHISVFKLDKSLRPLSKLNYRNTGFSFTSKDPVLNKEVLMFLYETLEDGLGSKNPVFNFFGAFYEYEIKNYDSRLITSEERETFNLCLENRYSFVDSGENLEYCPTIDEQWDFNTCRRGKHTVYNKGEKLIYRLMINENPVNISLLIKKCLTKSLINARTGIVVENINVRPPVRFFPALRFDHFENTVLMQHKFEELFISIIIFIIFVYCYWIIKRNED